MHIPQAQRVKGEEQGGFPVCRGGQQAGRLGIMSLSQSS